SCAPWRPAQPSPRDGPRPRPGPRSAPRRAASRSCRTKANRAGRCSWGGDVACFGDGRVVDAQDPGRALLESTLAWLDHVPADEVFDEVPHDVAVRAEHRVVEISITEELVESGKPMSLRQRVRRLDREPVCARQPLNGLHASQVRAGKDRRDRERLEDIDQLFGLFQALLAQRAEAVIACPVTAAAGFRVPDYVEGSHVNPRSAISGPCAKTRE